jgi:aspartyl-tRNA(Asn)/glutamyl-tRNA(Gln) amidotransferase subunit B
VTQSLAFARYYEAAREACQQPKAVANWLMGEVSRRLNAEGRAIELAPVSPRTLAVLISRIADDTISIASAKTVFAALWVDAGAEVDTVIEALGLKQMNDAAALEKIVAQVLAANQKSVDEFRAGKERAFNALVGQVMKASGGKANPGQVNELLRKKLAP